MKSQKSFIKQNRPKSSIQSVKKSTELKKELTTPKTKES